MAQPCLWIEGVGRPQDYTCANTMNSQLKAVLDRLPTDPLQIVYLDFWPLYIVRLPKINSSGDYFIQYNPQSGTVRKVIRFNASSASRLNNMIQDFSGPLVDTILGLVKDGSLAVTYPNPLSANLDPQLLENLTREQRAYLAFMHRMAAPL